MTYLYTQKCKFKLLNKEFKGEYSSLKNKIFADVDYLNSENRDFVSEVFKKYKPKNNYIYPVSFYLKKYMAIDLTEIQRLGYDIPKFVIL